MGLQVRNSPRHAVSLNIRAGCVQPHDCPADALRDERLLSRPHHANRDVRVPPQKVGALIRQGQLHHHAGMPLAEISEEWRRTSAPITSLAEMRTAPLITASCAEAALRSAPAAAEIDSA